ncbi:MAG: hypothetical protein HZB38_08595 [Planctomycetes bacterium]|nr:hypothetical protein [Planctomycetota bacterium]
MDIAGEHNMMTRLAGLLALSLEISAAACGQATQPADGPFDACGTLVQVGPCVLFSGGGGQYVLADFCGYHVGDTVRVVGTRSSECSNFCVESDGCIQGAKLYDPAVYPCGTDIPSLADDLVPALLDTACQSTSGLLAAIAAVGMAVTRRR